VIMADFATGFWIVMAVMMAAMLLLILGVAWLLLRPFSDWADSRRSHDPGLDELRRRFASGEIDADKYKERRRQLES
jgi:uncharacterized membrane protein